MKKVFLIIVSIIFVSGIAQEKRTINSSPKLVVGIVVDQMRYDYITRFYNRFGEGGFKRMINEGFNCKNNHFNYVPTYTGPGHASVYTGTTPRNHGIISNHWYDKFSKETVYCASDSSVKAVGSDNDMERMSPHRMKTTTVADQNRLHTQLKGKTIGIAIKDRGAILPAGHTANGAYWFRGKDEGKWITSTYYRNELPDWVKKFNESGKAKSYFKEWNTLYDINSYSESGADKNNFEAGYKGKEMATFPYDLAKLKDQNSGYDIIKSSAYGNSLTADFAIEAITGEQLGADEVTDFLTVSFSSTDYVGHNFGVNSKEIQDTYLRLDLDLERFLSALDQKVGKGQYTIFLTADHGAVHVPSYLKSLKIPAGYFKFDVFKAKVETFVKNTFKVDGLIEDISNNQVFFNYATLMKNSISAEDLQDAIAHFVLQENQIDKVFTRKQLESTNYTSGIEALIQKGYNQKRSGDVVVVLDPATISYSRTGSTHGSGLTYDTHAPLLFFGYGIKKGSTTQKTYITDIAPTISALLGITFPNGATGDVLPFVLD
ncbi:alkaline phosphatase PafA [Aquimarina mytili]|uniref:Alkaline phosphatase family protein n=1 Tax=Aquimarina mytili TaxID=874423 RepID=A0A936ZUT2_9FLAO|nr:alkaline phosphatase PafA [Aquimarina mytili]MBL0685083.1 alkaline phosphatase family protein [Aquimarina mytili]